MSETSERWRLPYLAAAQAQKEVTHNEAVMAVDQLLHLAVETRTLAVPPAAPLPGQAWIVAAAPSGAWTGQADAIAASSASGWRFHAPREGCLAWLRDAGVFAVFGPGGWISDRWPVARLDIAGRAVLGPAGAAVAPPAGGAVVDGEARAAITALLLLLRGQGIML